MRKYLLALLIILISLAGCKKADDVLTPTAVNIIQADDLNELSAVHTIDTQEAVSVQWAKDGSVFWLTGMWETMLFDGLTYEKLDSYMVDEFGVLYDTSPDGRTIALSLDPTTIVLYDIQNDQEVLSIEPGFAFSGSLFAPDGKTLAVISLDEIAVSLFDVQSGAQLDTLSGFETAAPIYSAQFGEDGSTFLWVSRGTVQPMELASKKMGEALYHEDFVSAAAVSPDSKYIATASAGTLTGGDFVPLVTLWDAKTGSIEKQMSFLEPIQSVAFSPNGKILVSGAYEALLFWDGENGSPLRTILDAHEESIISLAFSPDGSKLVTCSSDGVVKIWALD